MRAKKVRDESSLSRAGIGCNERTADFRGSQSIALRGEDATTTQEPALEEAVSSVRKNVGCDPADSLLTSSCEFLDGLPCRVFAIKLCLWALRSGGRRLT